MNNAARIAPEPMIEVTERRARWLLVCLIAASTLIFTFLAYGKHACLNWESPDTASIAFGFFHALGGKFFPYYGRPGCLLGEHADFILLAWYPIFRAAPAIGSLFLFQSLMISLAAWPTYLLARAQGYDRVTALIGAAGLLMFPPVVGQHVNQIHEDQFALVFLLFALCLFEKGAFRGFCLSIILATLAKETIALTVMMFGFYALIRRRSWKWTVVPLVWSAVYFTVMVLWLMPKWGTWGGVVYGRMAYFSQYGSTPGQVLSYFLQNPAGTLATILAPDRLMYLGVLLAPLLLVVPFRSWAWLLAAPTLLINLLGSNRLLRDLSWHYSIIPGALLWAGFLLAIPKWTPTLTRWLGPHNFARIFCLIGLLLGVSLCRVWLSPWQYRPSAAHQARLEAIAAVPINASVLSPENMLAHFVRHPAIHSLGGLRYFQRDPNEVFDYDYIVFDATYPSPDWQAQSQLFELISRLPEYRTVFARDGISVFQRVGNPKRVLRWRAARSLQFHLVQRVGQLHKTEMPALDQWPKLSRVHAGRFNEHTPTLHQLGA